MNSNKMKSTITKTLAGCMLLWLMAACEKDIDPVTISNGDTPTLAASATALKLDREQADNQAVAFDWEAMQLSWSNSEVATDIVTYTLQVGKAGDAFRTLVATKTVDALTAAFTVKELNEALIAAKYNPGETANLEARLLVAMATNRVNYSNVIDLTAVPYEDVVRYPSLYLAGGFNGWSHSDDFRAGSANDDGQYEGYVNFPDDNTEFKFSSVPGWDGINYGDGGGSMLSIDGGAGNLKAEAAGFYLLKANTGALTWSATKTTWGLIGDAVGSWDTDVPMVYDTETRLWTATVDMTASEWKFRANSGWDINFGASDKAGLLAYGGGNFKVEDAGTYLITLDLTNAGYYTYSIEKLAQ